jgi:methanogenic corrinoid protein MtbC1
VPAADRLPTVGSHPVDRAEFDRIASTGRTAEAEAWAEGLLDSGAAVLDVLDAVAVVQRLVGERWAAGAWTVAREHTATIASAAAVAAVERRVAREPVSRGHVLLACCDREWHVVPAAIVGVALRSHGWSVTMLGASTSPVRFSQAVQDLGPDLTAISCSVLDGLPAARRLIEASTAAGVPVLAGGRAFGDDPTRALRLGATLWAGSAREAVARLEHAPAVVTTAAPLEAESGQERAALELARDAIAERLVEAWDPRLEPPGLLGETTADVVGQALSGVEASLLTGEPGPLRQAVMWATGLLVGRGVDASNLRFLGNLLEVELREYPLAHAMVVQHWT